MRISAPCPVCSQPLSVWSVMRAPTPLNLRCGHCLRPLRARNLTLPLVLAGLVFGVLLGKRLIDEARLVGGLPVRGLLLGLALVVAFDLLASLAIVNLGRLTPR